MKPSTLYKNNLDVRIKEFCQNSIELLESIHARHLNRKKKSIASKIKKAK